MDEPETDYLELLVRTVKPPAQPVYNDGPVSWDEIESAIGFALPNDYKQLIHTYGYGQFGADPYGNYLGFYNPFRYTSVEAFVARLSRLSNIVNANKEKFPDEYPPFEFFPKGPVVMLGFTDDAGNVSWFRETGKDGGGSIVTTDADFSPNFGYYRKTLTRFLYEWVTGQIVVYGFRDIPLADRAVFIPAKR